MTLPEDIGNLQENLTSILLTGSFAAFPSSFYNLTRLQSLGITFVSDIGPISSALSQLVGLETLRITGSYTVGGSLPPLAVFPKLKILLLDAVGLVELPDLASPTVEVIYLRSLYFLRAVAPTSSSGMPNLQSFTMDSLANGLSFNMPIRNATKLNYINFDSCGVNTTLPDEIFNPSLQFLTLSQVAQLEMNLSTCPLASAINLVSLSIVVAPKVTGVLNAPPGGFPYLNQLYLSGAPITDIAPSFANSGFNASGSTSVCVPKF